MPTSVRKTICLTPALLAMACVPGDPLEPASLVLGAGPSQTSPQIKVDQFGYRPADPKVAVIVDPQQGFNASESFAPSNTYEVRRWSDDQVVFTDTIGQWNGGQTQASSGDRDLLNVETNRGAKKTISTAKYKTTSRGGKGTEIQKNGRIARVLPEPPQMPIMRKNSQTVLAS